MTDFGESASDAKKKKKVTHTAQAHQPLVDRAESTIIHKPVAQLATTSRGAIGNENWNSTNCKVNYGSAGPAPLNSVPAPTSAFSTVPKMLLLHVTPLRPSLTLGPMHYSHTSTTPYSIVRPIAQVGQQLPTYADNRPNCTTKFDNVNELLEHGKDDKVHPVRPEPRYLNVEISPASQFADASTSQSLGHSGPPPSLQLPAKRPTDASDDAPYNKEKNEKSEYVCKDDRCGGALRLLSDSEKHNYTSNEFNFLEELKHPLDKIIVLFHFIHDRGEAFYKVDLSKRLCVGKSASADAEESLLLKLKQEFTGKLEGIFKDINIAFEPYSGNPQYEQIMSSSHLNVSILTRGHSPNSPGMAVILPSEMVLCHDIFNKFYRRKLQWQPTLGHCVLKVWSKQDNNILRVSLFQAPVLFLVNDSGNISLKEVKAVTNIEDGELRRTLQVLACGKARLVHKGQRIGGRFILNVDSTDKLFRITINPIQIEEDNEELTATVERECQDIRHQIDMAILRMMKMKRTLIHIDLITELLKQLTLPVMRSDLNERIEFLINRDYMERDRDNTNQYNYLE